MGCYVFRCGCSKQKREQRAFEQGQIVPQHHALPGEPGAAPAAEGLNDKGFAPAPLPPGALYQVPEPQELHRQYKQRQQGAPRYGGAPGDASCYGRAGAIKVVMAVIVVLALGAAGVTIWGMTELHKGMSEQGWDAVSAVVVVVVVGRS